MAIAFGLVAPPPRLFPYSDAVLLGGAAFAIALGAGMMLPDRLRLTGAERATMALIESGRVTEATAKPVVAKIEVALAMARRLRAADRGFRADLSDLVRRVAMELEAVADEIWEEPNRVWDFSRPLARGELAVEAVEKHARIRRSRKVTAQDIDISRAKVLQTLADFEDVLDEAARRRIEARMEALDVTTSVAGALFSQMKG